MLFGLNKIYYIIIRYNIFTVSDYRFSISLWTIDFSHQRSLKSLSVFSAWNWKLYSNTPTFNIIDMTHLES